MDHWQGQLRKGLVELAVLAAIGPEETYGYRIVEELRQLEGLEFTESTVYPVLTRLAREGLLTVSTRPSPTGPPRRYYRLTGEGEKRLGRMTGDWKTVSDSLSTLLKGVRQ